MTRVWTIVIGLILSACESRRPAPLDDAPSDAPPSKPVKADALVAEAVARAGPGMRITRLDLRYVRSDGVIDAEYGRIEIKLRGPDKPLPPDDPARPVGAPSRRRRPIPDCDAYRWQAGRWVDDGVDRLAYQGVCWSSSYPDPIRCSIAALWRLAIADGAPADALATFQLSAPDRWLVSIEDEARGISFTRTYPDDAARCRPVAERAEGG